MIEPSAYQLLKEKIEKQQAILCAVSKMQSVEKIEKLYALGQRVFGENYVQEFVQKQAKLPSDIEWHYIGHLQSNKVKQIIPFVHTIQSIDSISLLDEVSKQAIKWQKNISCFLQIHIAQEDSKFGFQPAEALNFIKQYNTNTYSHINITGVMGMATFTTNPSIIKSEFVQLKELYDQIKALNLLPAFEHCSMGMSGDFELALAQGSTIVRIGSLLFGQRNYSN